MSSMSTSINTGFIRTLTPEETSKELQALRTRLPDEKITRQLLEAIERGSLSTPTFAVWLGISKSPTVVQQLLRQKSSVHARFLGIKQLRFGLESTQWKKFWDGLGGTAGLLNIFNDLSALEVRVACKAISRSAKGGDVDEKRRRITELFEGLHPNIFPNATFKTTDLRPLTKSYQALIPGCTTELVNRIVDGDQKGKWQYVRERELLEQHSSNVGRAAVHWVFENQSSDTKHKDRLQALSTRLPSSTTSGRGFSASMAFALDLLRELVETGSKYVDDEWILKNLIRPLLKRAVRKKASWSRLQEITALSLRYLEHHRAAAKLLTSAKGDVLHMVASCWSRRSTLFEAQLKTLLNMVFGSTTAMKDFTNLLAGIPKSRRYSLLRLCAQEIMGVDLEIEEDLQKVQGPLTSHIIDSIEASQALGLFKRLRSARGDVNLVERGCGYSVSMLTRTPDVREGDPDIYYLILLHRNGLDADAESYAAELIEARKKTTSTCSNRDRRAEYAVSVLACASASGSLRLLADTVKWAKGFVRDQLTACKLFSEHFSETYLLLSGVPMTGKGTLKPQELRQRIECANAIMLDLLDVICAAICEPFFRTKDWRGSMIVFRLAICERMQRSADLQKEMNASDEEMYYALWEDTITTLVLAERKAIQEGQGELHFNTASGAMTFCSQSLDSELKESEVATWKFLDNLAKARNEFWEELRPTRHPDVLTLSKPLPRGLPVNSLIPPFRPGVANLQKLAPYIWSRVEAAVFADPEFALEPVPVDETTQQAIGPFVDNYQYALRAYIPDSCDTQEKEKRLTKAWNHATDPLSESRMNLEEAQRYWRQFMPQYLESILNNILPKSNHEQWPKVPELDDPMETQEWNPLESRPIEVKARELGTVTYIDLSTLGEYERALKSEIGSYPQLPTPQVPAGAGSGGAIWDDPSDIEGAALAAALYLDTKHDSDERLLATPFPSRADVRYPCLYLDEEFLSREELRLSDAAAYLSRNIGAIPLPLVHKISTALLRTFDPQNPKENSRILDQAAFPLIQALSKSDNPGLASKLAIQAMVELPTASSWGRILLNNGFLQRLPASDARDCIQVLAEAVGGRLDAQARAKSEKQDKAVVDGASETPTVSGRNSRKPFVKITTVKSLAQLLHSSTFIGENSTLSMLSELSSKVSHIDVRVSILSTLLSKLQDDRPEVWDRVFAALDPFLKLAGSLNEREPMTEDDWTHAEETLSMPELQTTDTPLTEEGSPMMALLISHYRKLDGKELLSLFANRVMLPIIELLKKETARWTSLFLRKYASDNTKVLETPLPSCPRGLKLLYLVLSVPGSTSHRIPQALLDEYVAYTAFNIAPPVPIRALNQTLEEDPAVKSRPEVKTWLMLYGCAQLRPFMLPFDTIADFVDQKSADSDVYVTPRSFQQYYLKFFTALLWAEKPDGYYLKAFTISLVGFWHGGKLGASWWNEYGRTTVEAMIAYVNSLRTQDWERDPNRQPVVLPDTFPWRLILLSYPLPNRDDTSETRDQKCMVFAQQLAALIDEISSTMYHGKLTRIKQYTRECSTYEASRRDNMLVSALYLGDISKTRLSWLTVPDLLRVDLASSMILITKSGVEDESLKVRLRELLQSWIESENEEVRKFGYYTRKEYGWGMEC